VKFTEKTSLFSRVNELILLTNPNAQIDGLFNDLKNDLTSLVVQHPMKYTGLDLNAMDKLV
jgi:hypothetical protein